MKTLRDIIRLHSKTASLYIVFGLTALAVELLVFQVSQSQLPLFAANLLAVVCGMFISFSLNVWLNFRVNGRMLARFVSYALTVGIGYVVSSSILYALTALSVSPMLAKLVSLPVVFLLQYGINYRFAFKEI